MKGVNVVRGKRFLSIILCVIITFCYIPIISFGAETADAADKIALSIKSGKTEAKLKLNQDYTITAVFPRTTVDLSKVTVGLSLRDIPYMGISNLLSSQVEVKTGLVGDDVGWTTALPGIANFSGGKLHMEVGGNATDYSLVATETSMIGTPADSIAAQAAWRELSRHLSLRQYSTEDNDIYLPSSAYLKTSGNDMATLYIPRNSYIRIGTLQITVTDGITISLSGIDASKLKNINLRDYTDTVGMIKLLDKFIGAISGKSASAYIYFTVYRPDPPDDNKETVVDPWTGVITTTEVEANDKGEVVATVDSSVTVTPEMSETGVSTAQIPKNVMDKLIEQTISGKEKAEKKGATSIDTTISIDTRSIGSADETAVRVTVDATQIKMISEKTSASVKLETDMGDMKLDNKALESIAKKSGTAEMLSFDMGKTEKLPETVDKLIGEKSLAIDLSITAGDKKISDFDGGKVEVTLQVPDMLKESTNQVLYISSYGIGERMKGKAAEKGGIKYYTFTAPHFSTYALAEKTAADKVMKQTQAKLKAGVAKTKILSLKGKPTKGKVSLTWKKSNSGYKVDGYQIWRSTKSTKGYVKYFTTKNLKYTNTKNVKRGTSYYYKITGYRVVDGKTFYTPYKTIKVRAK